MQYTVTGKLAYLNDHDSANRSNKFMGAKLKEKMTTMVVKQLVGQPPVTVPCIISFEWLYASRHDFDNIRFAAKYVLDGMQKAGVLQNDNQAWVKGFGGDHFTKVLPGDEGVIITIEPYNE